MYLIKKNSMIKNNKRARTEKESELVMEMKRQERVRCKKNGDMDMATNPGVPFHQDFAIDPLNFSLSLLSVMFPLPYFLVLSLMLMFFSLFSHLLRFSRISSLCASLRADRIF